VGTNFEENFEASLAVLNVYISMGECINTPMPVEFVPTALVFKQDDVKIVEVVPVGGGEPVFMLMKGNAMFFLTRQDLDAHNATEASN
jgi:hypothetical protein